MRRMVSAAVLLCASAAANAAGPQPICPDRPSKSTGECTVPVGRWQLETGLIDWTHGESDGVSTDFTTFGSSLLKFGISGDADVELGFTPYAVSRVRSAGTRDRESGFGDVVVRVKYRLTPVDSPFQAALDPFVKVPTASHNLGNGKVEGGMTVPLSAALGKSGLILSFDPEVDLLADADGRGRHVAMVQVVNLGSSLTDKLSISGELWGQWDWDSAGTTRQASADASAAYLVSNDLQLDAGANFGLNRNTPDVELYTGISVRF
jgi:hypothetical protein